MAALPNGDQIQDLQLLRYEYERALRNATRPEDKQRLQRMIDELTACIERLEGR